MKITRNRFIFALPFATALLCSAVSAAELDANERLYPQPKDQVYSAIVSTFNRLQIPIQPSGDPASGTVIGSSATGGFIMKVTNVTAQAITTADGTRVTYTRSKANALNLTRKPDNDPKPMNAFFDALDAELAR